MAIRRQAPNGTIVKFPDGTDEATIKEYLARDEFQPIKNKKTDKDRNFLTDVPLQAVGGVFDAVDSTIGFIEGIGDTLGEKTNIGGLAFGKDAKNGLIEYVSYDEFKKRGLSDPLFGKAGEKDAIDFTPEIDAPDTMVGGFTRGVSQFLTGWFTGGKLLKGGSSLVSTNVAVKGANLIAKNPVKTSLVRGAFADTVAFDEETGRLTDVIINYAPSTKDTWLGYLASDPDDTFWQGRFKNAIEGLALGGLTESVFRTYRYVKNTNDKRLGNKVTEKQKKEIKEDEKFLNEKNEANLNPKAEQVAVRTQSKITDLEIKPDEIIEQNYNKFIKGEIDLDQTLDLGLNVNSFRALSKDGINQVQAITKSLEKQLAKLKEPQIYALLERRAERQYNGDILKVLKDGEELAGSMDKGRTTIIAHETLTQSLLNVFPKMTRAYKNGTDNVTLKEVQDLHYLLEKAFLNTAEIRTRWGQMGQIFQGVKDKALSFDDLGNKIKGITTDFKNYGGNYEEFLDQIAKADNNRAVGEVLRWVGKNKTWAVLNEVWINALLSSPKTHLINMTSNVINTFIRPLEVALGSRMNLWLENPAKVRMLREQGREATSVFAGLFRYLDEVLEYTKLAFKNEDTIIGGASGRTKLDTPLKATGDGTLGKIVRTPSRFLNAEDEFFKQISYRAKLYQLAVKDAIEKNKSTTKVVGTNIKNRKPITEFDAHVVNFERAGFDETGLIGINPDALRYAEETTFTQNLSGITKQVQDITNKYPIFKQVLPFVRTPINLFKATMDRIPVAGLLRKEFRDDFVGRSGNAYRMAEARGKQAIGLATMTMAGLIFKDRISGGQPTSEIEANLPRNLQNLAKTDLGFVPYSVRIGDKQYSFGRLDPFGALFGIVADFNRYYDLATREELEKLGNATNMLLWTQTGENSLSTLQKAQNFTGASWSALTRNVFSKTYLQSLMEIIKIATDDDTYTAERWFQNKIGSYIPNIYTKLVNDPYFREAKTITDNLKKRSGFFTKEVQVKHNIFGEKLEYSGDFTERLIRTLINPLGTTEVKEDIVAEEFIRLGQSVPDLNIFLDGKLDTTKFKNEKGQSLYDRWNEIISKDLKLKKELEKIIKSQGYQNLTDPITIDSRSKDKGKKHEVLVNVIKKTRKIAKAKLLSELKNFTSITDDRLNAQVSFQRALKNNALIKSGFRENSDVLLPLYQLGTN